jgi:hypothetical protein
MSAAQLDAFSAAHRRAQQRLHALIDPLSDEQFNWKPEEGIWSVGEVVAHLNAMARGYLPPLEAKLTGALPDAGGRQLKHGWIARQFVKAVSPDGRPMNTFGRIKPPASAATRSSLNKPHLMSDLDGYTDRFVALAERSRGKAIDTVGVRSPFLPVLKLSAAAFLDALGQHSLRHAGQAERVAQRPGFPSR